MSGIRLALILTSSILCSLLFSCKGKKDNGEQDYYYYPKKNVYYSPQTQRFFYSLNGGKTWDSTLNLSDDIPQTLGEKVEITSTNRQVYRDNDRHRTQYQGVLYDFSNSSAPLTAAATTVVERSTVVKKRVTPRVTNNRPEQKKGIGGFFKKLFGKDKK